MSTIQLMRFHYLTFPCRGEESEKSKGKPNKSKKRKSTDDEKTESAPASTLVLPVALAQNICRILTDFVVLGFCGAETVPKITEIFKSILSGASGMSIFPAFPVRF